MCVVGAWEMKKNLATSKPTSSTSSSNVIYVPERLDIRISLPFSTKRTSWVIIISSFCEKPSSLIANFILGT